MLDMTHARELFDASTDFTFGIEEEFQILDSGSRQLTGRYEELRDAAAADERLAEAVAGELISSEIEVRSRKGHTFAEALADQRESTARLFALAADRDLELAATGTHPWSPWQDQRIIDTDHYRRLNQELRYVAWRNNTFSLHVHVGIRGADRAIAVCDRMRSVLPELLALSANSPFLEGRDSGLQSVRTQIFTKSFPRCGIPDPLGDFAAYADYVDFLVRTGSVVEHTQIWWSIRPHHRLGTVEVRICDAQSSAEDAGALAGIVAASVAQAALDHDDGVAPAPVAGRLIEENLWRALRHGLDGRMIDLERREEYPAAALPDRMLAWTAPARAALGIDAALPAQNGAQRQRRALEAGATIEEVFAGEVQCTQDSYSKEPVST